MDFLHLYREIGKVLHGLGADRAVILNSKATSNEKFELKLEIAVDGEIELVHAEQVCRKNWRNIDLTLLDLNDYANEELLYETLEDGIRI